MYRSILFFATVHPPLLPLLTTITLSGVLSNSTIGQDDGKCQARHIALHFPRLVQAQRWDVLSVSRRLMDDEQELHIPPQYRNPMPYFVDKFTRFHAGEDEKMH